MIDPGRPTLHTIGDVVRADRAVHSDVGASVVVITKDRRRELGRSLERLQGLPERPGVLVIDNGSSDGTAEMVLDAHPEVALLAPGRNLGAAARNLGVLAARTPYVAFCDDDTWWSPGSIARAVGVMEDHPRVAVVTGRIVVEPSGEEDPICEDLRTSPLPVAPDVPGPSLVSFLAGASVVRRSAFLFAGGFEPRVFIGGEEELLASDLLRAGWAIVYDAEVEVHHQPSRMRDPHVRRRQGVRNTLWFSWLRRPLPSALRRTREIVSMLPADAVSARALADAVRGIPWVLRARRPVPPEVERLYRVVDAVQFRSGARRYVS